MPLQPDALIIQLDIVSDFTPLTRKIALTPIPSDINTNTSKTNDTGFLRL
jgi:hypothetical protein